MALSPYFRGLDSIELAHHFQVLQRGQLFIKSPCFWDEPHSFLGLKRILLQIDASNANISRIGRQQTSEDFQSRGLPSPVGSEVAQDFSLPHGKRNVIDSYLGAKSLSELGDFKEGRIWRHTGCYLQSYASEISNLELAS